MEIQKSIDDIIKKTVQKEITKALDTTQVKASLDKEIQKFVKEKGTYYMNEKITTLTKNIISEFMNTKGKQYIDEEAKNLINKRISEAFKSFGQSFTG